MANPNLRKWRRLVSRAYSRTLKEVSPAVSLVASLIAVIVAVYSLAEGRARESVNSQLYLEGTAAAGPCASIAETTPAGCTMSITPHDKTMHLLREMILFPTSVDAGGGQHYSVSLGPPTLEMSELSEQLWQRAEKYYQLTGKDPYVASTLPIAILSSYIYNGKRYTDTSAYLVMFAITKDGHKTTPVSLVFCGRLKFWPDFVVDPVLPAVVGYSDRASRSVMFDCEFGLTRIDIPRGQNLVLTTAAQRALSGQRFPSGSFPTTSQLKIAAHPPVGKATEFHTSDLAVED